MFCVATFKKIHTKMNTSGDGEDPDKNKLKSFCDLSLSRFKREVVRSWRAGRSAKTGRPVLKFNFVNALIAHSKEQAKSGSKIMKRLQKTKAKRKSPYRDSGAPADSARTSGSMRKRSCRWPLKVLSFYPVFPSPDVARTRTT